MCVCVCVSEYSHFYNSGSEILNNDREVVKVAFQYA